MTKRDIKYIALFGAIGLFIVVFGLLRVKFDLLLGEPIDSALWILAGPVALVGVYISLGDFYSSILFVVYYCLIGFVISRLLFLKGKALKIFLILLLIILHAYIGYSAGELFKERLKRALEGLIKSTQTSPESAQVPHWKYCESNEDCEAMIIDCDCTLKCLNKLTEIDYCSSAKNCKFPFDTQICYCQNNQCVEGPRE